MTPPLAAREIGFSESLLRRYALIYQSIGGEIPTDSRGGRLYPREVLGKFAEVRDLVKAGETVKDAMLTVTAGEIEPTGQLEASDEPLALLKRLVEANERQAEELRRLNERIGALEAQLQALPPPKEERRPWWRLWSGKER